jgi:hypothetical protein
MMIHHDACGMPMFALVPAVTRSGRGYRRAHGPRGGREPIALPTPATSEAPHLSFRLRAPEIAHGRSCLFRRSE